MISVHAGNKDLAGHGRGQRFDLEPGMRGAGWNGRDAVVAELTVRRAGPSEGDKHQRMVRVVRDNGRAVSHCGACELLVVGERSALRAHSDSVAAVAGRIGDLGGLGNQLARRRTTSCSGRLRTRVHARSALAAARQRRGENESSKSTGPVHASHSPTGTPRATPRARADTRASASDPNRARSAPRRGRPAQDGAATRVGSRRPGRRRCRPGSRR